MNYASTITPDILLNVAQRCDSLDLLRSLPTACSPLAFFDPQHRGILDHLKFGNEGARQRGRANPGREFSNRREGDVRLIFGQWSDSGSRKSRRTRRRQAEVRQARVEAACCWH